MSKAKRKYLFLLAVVLLFTFSLSSIAVGAPAQKLIKILSNGQQVTGDKQPVMINGSVYVPLRMMGNIFNKNVGWDNAAYAVLLTDKADPNVQKNQQQIQELQKTIDQLKAQIADRDSQIIILKAQLTAMQEDNEVMDLDDLEEQLNDDYGDYEDIEFEISLSGDEEDVTVAIEVDLDDYSSEWDDLSSSDKEDLLQDIVDDILEEYEDADIEGSIDDSYEDEELLSFTVDSSGDVDVEEAEADLSDLESELEDYYLDYFDEFDFDFIELDGDEDDITFTVFLDYDEYETEFDALVDSDDIEDFMTAIYDDILDEYEDADVTGYVRDSNDDSTLYRY